MFVWWGQEFTNLYNDAYAPILGRRHPPALGQSAPVIWTDVWDVVGPQAEAVLYEGRSSWNEELLLIMERYGYPEETYFTFSYSPITNDTGGVGGVFCAVAEDTTRVLGQRRLHTLRELAALTAPARNAEEACRLAAGAIAKNSHDVPFALMYLLEATGQQARLASAVGVETGTLGAPPHVDVAQEEAWPLRGVMESGDLTLVENVIERIGVTPGGPWPDPPTRAMVLPLAQAGQAQLTGFFVAGVSPRRPLDDDYRGFLGLLAGQVATAISDAQAYEIERQRAEALAELDRAKTLFLTNISHEFRTPLSLILGPVEGVLTKPEGEVQPEDRALLNAHHNGLRLLKLVNTLLDFSRIEAGRMQAVYERTDIAALTSDLASQFRSAVERAGMQLIVNCPTIDTSVYLDRDMWEKIVLNLLSNAFKFTFEGEIEVRLCHVDETVELTVRDTGVGIPAKEVPFVFERFHRVEGARRRSHEGTGSGLALVYELVKLHSGAVSVDSVESQGTTFTVSIPTGSAHLPAYRIGVTRTLSATSLGPDLFVEEALGWLPDDEPAQLPSLSLPSGEAIVTVQDTGIGIPAELLPHIFEMFTRGEPPPDQTQSGLGIGLTLVKRIVELHGGSVMAHSDGSSTGTTFIIRLPVGSDTLAARPHASPESERMVPAASRRILVVEDEWISAASLERLQRLKGHDVRTAHDGLEALAAAEAFRPHVVLLDIGLPEMTGYEVAHRIRQQPWGQGMVLIALTGWGQEADRQRSTQAGFDHHLVKPVAPAALLHLLTSL